MSQQLYTINMSPAFEGTIADSRPCQVMSGRNDTASELLYGKFVSRGPNADGLGIKLPAAAEVLLGVLTQSHREESVLGLEPKSIGNVLSQGVVNMIVENAVTQASGVLVRIDSGGSGAGSLRGGAAVAASLVLIPGARFLSAASAGAIVQVEFNLPAMPALA
jgi:hypothetical protein